MKYESILIVIQNCITEHYITVCCFKKVLTGLKNSGNIRYYRDKSKFDRERFCTELKINLRNHFTEYPPLTMQNFNTTFDEFVAVIANTIDKHAPQKRLFRKQKK